MSQQSDKKIEKFEDLLTVGFVNFYGVDHTTFRVGVDGKQYTFEAVENDSDYGRSELLDVRLKSSPELVFSRVPFCKVTVQDTAFDDNFDGYQLVDEAGHVWLKFGTNLYDTYYPLFVFNYTPKGVDK